MNHLHTALLLVSLLALSAAMPTGSARAGEAARPADLVSTALADGRFETLSEALNRADLIAALRGPGPFTLFAPTDAAFAALPADLVSGLLRPERRADLAHLLLAHVVQGRVLAADLLTQAQVETRSGSRFPVGLRIGEANVTQADVLCRNGVIHVIDRVLLPPARPAPMSAHDIRAAIHAAIDKGVPLFNAGDAAACAEIYHETALSLTRQGAGAVSDLARQQLSAAVEATYPSDSKRAWALREAFDTVLDDLAFEPTMEAALPQGFPAPGAVGYVVRKQYPRYRAARAEGGGQGMTFWTLFQHIKQNNVEMTAPVEMSMDQDMKMRDMAFLYESPEQGRSGAQGRVHVLDLDRVEVLSIGMRGRRSDDALRQARALVEMRMQELGLQASGSWRVLGYNSPMVATSRQYWELQVPVVSR